MTEPVFRRVAVVMNGAAGALLDQSDAAETLRALFTAAGLDPEFVPIDAGTLPERIARARGLNLDAVVVAGGDGTIACAAQAMTGTDTVLGILPFGTMNLLAKDLRITVGDTAAAMRVLSHGVARAIDVAEVNGHVFLCASMLGLPAQIGRHREARRGAGWLLARWVALAHAALRTIRRHAPAGMVLEIDGHAERSRAASITVTANALGDPSHLFGRPALDRGELVVYVIERVRLLDLPRLAFSLLRGRARRDGLIAERRTTELVVHSRRRALRVMNDGEGMLLRPPLRYRIRPGALRVIAPDPVPDPAVP